MYRLINENREAVVQALVNIGDIAEYTALRTQLEADCTNALKIDFQQKYRRYWRMNAARLGPNFYERYFALLRERRESNQADVLSVARELGRHSGEDGLQFSFATKLCHMVDARVPVYDSFVASFYFYTPPAATLPFGERLKELMAFHRFLDREYRRVIETGLLADAIKLMRSSWHLDDSLPDQRVIDWLIWSWVSLLRKGAQLDGKALFN